MITHGVNLVKVPSTPNIAIGNFMASHQADNGDQRESRKKYNSKLMLQFNRIQHDHMNSLASPRRTLNDSHPLLVILTFSLVYLGESKSFIGLNALDNTSINF